ncbi:hypothetical protein [Micromonospora sp. NBC_01638]|uniref:hypothetical protein n=1 Tax=Micromonospora sp. NBC_01638 TaxID=2975982 RepID=UPI003864FFCF|nr:hypothetical protein OG811_21805 [Micromonospora sp. NBC_01638]
MEIKLRHLELLTWPAPAPHDQSSRTMMPAELIDPLLPLRSRVSLNPLQIEMIQQTSRLERIRRSTIPVVLVLQVAFLAITISEASTWHILLGAAAFLSAAFLMLLYPVAILIFRRRGMPFVQGDILVMCAISRDFGERLVNINRPGAVTIKVDRRI